MPAETGAPREPRMRHYDWLSHHALHRHAAPCWEDLHSGRAFTYAAAEDRCRRLAAHLSRA